MVELRKRPAPPAAPPPAKKKAPAKPKAKKDAPKAAEVEEAPAAAPSDAKSVTEKPAKGGAPKVGDSITLESFGGDIETNDGDKTTLAKLVADSKAGVVLFTYPKASTPGCRHMIAK